MSLILRLILLVACLVPVGCLSALQKHNERVRAEQRSEGIATACQQKDVAKLKEYLDYEPDRQNREAATTCLVDLQMAALTQADCATFSAAFVEREEHQEGRIVVSKRSSLIDFRRYLLAEPREKVAERQAAIVDKAWACHDNVVLFTNAGNALLKDDADTWNPLYARLENTAGDGSVLARMLESMREEAPLRTLDSTRVAAWLEETKPVGRCKDLEEASRGKAIMRQYLLYFFLRNNCKGEATSIATEQLVSKDANARMDACLAFGRLKDKSRVADMRRLAQTDTARSIDRERIGFLTYAYVTYPVREACQQTLNELEVGK